MNIQNDGFENVKTDEKKLNFNPKKICRSTRINKLAKTAAKEFSIEELTKIIESYSEKSRLIKNIAIKARMWKKAGWY